MSLCLTPGRTWMFEDFQQTFMWRKWILSCSQFQRKPSKKTQPYNCRNIFTNTEPFWNLFHPWTIRLSKANPKEATITNFTGGHLEGCCLNSYHCAGKWFTLQMTVSQPGNAMLPHRKRGLHDLCKWGSLEDKNRVFMLVWAATEYWLPLMKNVEGLFKKRKKIEKEKVIPTSRAKAGCI